MFWIMFIAWMLPALAVYRRAGYAIEQTARNGHEFQDICDACVCANCGGRWGYHFRFTSIRGEKRCNNFEFRNGFPHARTGFAFFPIFFLWPLIVLGYGGMQLKALIGHETKPFFTPPPVIESRKDKAERILREREAEIERVEKELGIGGYTN